MQGGPSRLGSCAVTDRVAVVTGANRGIGRAIAVALAADGFAVAVTARDSATLADTVAAIEADGGTALAVPCDVRDEESVIAMARDVADLGRVHTVVAMPGSPVRRRRYTRYSSPNGATAWPLTLTACSSPSVPSSRR